MSRLSTLFRWMAPRRHRRRARPRRARRVLRAGRSVGRAALWVVRPAAALRALGRVADRAGRRMRRRRRARRWSLGLHAPLLGRGALGLAVVASTVSAALLVAPPGRSARLAHTSAGATLPVFPIMPADFDGVSVRARLAPPALSRDELEADELLRSPVLSDPEFARAVHWWVDYWRLSARRWFPGFLERMAWRGGAVDSALAAGGLPPSLRYLPLIESGYDPTVTSRAAAVGMWQLMPGTARDMGLEITPLVDERRHAARSTEAAVAYLADLHEDFGSWFLTLAAYNSGPARVRGILRRHAPDAPRTDSLYWAIREHLPAETRDFVPKLFGAMWVASRPDAYGYDVPEEWGQAYDEVEIPNRTTLDVVARAAGVSHDEVRRLNPEWLLGVTPPSRAVTLRLPRGTAEVFARSYLALPWGGRMSFPEHVVQSGETFSEIAGRYGVRAEDIQAVNGHVDPGALREGARLRVPVALPVEGS